MGFRCGEPSAPRDRSRRRGLALLAAGLLLLQAGGAARAADGAPYRGRPLIEVLRELRQSGLELIFSTAVVGRELRVQSEPTATEPRRLLDEILEPLGLEGREGPSGSILILPRGRGAGELRGRVLDDESGLPIGGATVTVRAPGLTVRSGADGTFEIAELPAGSYDVGVEAFGFAARTIAGVRVVRGAVATVEARLRTKARFMTEIVVTPNQHSVARERHGAVLEISAEEADLVPSIAGEVSRVVQFLPGVSAADNSAGFHVRGSEVEDVALILDGLELYEPYHLASLQSPFSLIDNRIVDRIDFLGGGFTADLGDRHGGFVEISTLQPESSTDNAIELGSMKSAVLFGGQIPEQNGSWLLAARGWYPEALRDDLGLGGGEKLDPRLGDLYVKSCFTVASKLLLSVHGLLAYDRVEFVENNNLPGEENESANVLTRTGYVWLRGQGSWSPELSSETVISAGRIERRRSGVSVPMIEDIRVRDDRDVGFLGLRHDMTWQLSDDHSLRAGVEARRLDAAYRYSKEDLSDPSASISIDLDPAGTLFSAYLAHRARLTNAFATEVGLRWDKQAYNNENQLSPRFNAAWQLGRRSELRLALGRFNQSQRINELHVEDGETTFSPSEISKQAELTYQHTATHGVNFRVDGYYRKLSRLRPRYENLFRPIELFPETGDDRVTITPDRAFLQGVEFLVRGDAERPLTWWVGYALSSARDEIDGRTVPRSWDQTHSGKLLVGYRWGDRWSVSLGSAIHTGWPTTPVSGEVAPGGSIEPVLGPRNSARFPTYVRVDAKAQRTFHTTRGKLSLALELFNLNNRRNPCCVDEVTFSTRPDGSVESRPEFESWLGFTPSFSILWEY